MWRAIIVATWILTSVPCLGQAPQVERYQRSLVVVRCPVEPWGDLTQRIGIPIRDRNTVLSTLFNARCRRNLVVQLESGERISVRSMRPDPQTGLALYELAAPLPYDPVPIEASDGAEGTVYSFRFAQFGESGRGTLRRVERPASSRARGGTGSPLLDENGRLIGVLGGYSFDDIIHTSRALALLDDPPTPRSTHRAISGSVFMGLPSFYEPRRSNAPALFGLGLELGAELVLDDTAFLASSSSFFAIGPFDNDGHGGWRAQFDVRGGARITLSDWAVLTLEGGIVLGVEARPEWDIGGDGELFWARPMARASIRLFGATLAYSLLVDLEQPAASTHQLSVGFAFDLP